MGSSTTQSILAWIIIIIVLSAAFFYPWITITEEVEYQTTEEFVEKVPYTVDVEREVVTNLLNENIQLQSANFEVIDFSIDESRTYSLEWSGTENIVMVSVMKESTWTILKVALIAEIGVLAASELISSGTITAAIIPLIEPIILTTMSYIVTSNDYYSLGRTEDSLEKNFKEGLYKLVVLHLGNPSSIDANLHYSRTEIVQEIRFNNVTKTRPVTETQTETITISFYDFLIKSLS